MKTRIITALLALIIFLPLLWLGGLPLMILVSVLGLIAVWEFFNMKKISMLSWEGAVVALGTLMLLLPDSLFELLPDPAGMHLLYYLMAMVLLIITVLSKNQFTFDDAGSFALIVLYIGTGFHYLLKTAAIGFFMVMLILLIIWSTDIGAYLVGRKLGKHKLAPLISPNKTIEGSLGGTLIAVLVAVIYTSLYNPLHFSGIQTVLMALVLSVIGQLGDLLESAFKRYYGVKDSGKLLPGHGGVLDRFDSTLLVMPAFHLFLQFFQ